MINQFSAQNTTVAPMAVVSPYASATRRELCSSAPGAQEPHERVTFAAPTRTAPASAAPARSRLSKALVSGMVAVGLLVGCAGTFSAPAAAATSTVSQVVTAQPSVQHARATHHKTHTAKPGLITLNQAQAENLAAKLQGHPLTAHDRYILGNVHDPESWATLLLISAAAHNPANHRPGGGWNWEGRD